MDLNLAAKRALITGSTAGIGVAIARALAREGCDVVVHGRDVARAEHVAKEIMKEGRRAFPVIADLSTESGPHELYQGAVEGLGGLDILVNNAGEYAGKNWFETTRESWEAFYRTDVLSAVGLILEAGPAMSKQGWGRIVNIATGMASTPQVMMPDYAAAKAALVNATLSSAKALAGSGVTVNTISPGLIHTPNVEKILRDEAKKRSWGDDWETIQRRWFDDILGDRTLKRLGRPKEVADLVAFVVSPLAAYVNGTNLRIDGGKSPSIN